MFLIMAAGWDRNVLYGNCILWDTHFWYRPDVQKYLDLQFRLGKYFSVRWQEQAVQAMIWGLFAPAENFEFLDIPMAHGGSC